jgi:hemin uptake protein HemP
MANDRRPQSDATSRPAPDTRAAPPTGAASPTGADAADATPRVVNSDALLGGRSQLAILHNETIYFLRQTRFGKLILTK